MDWTEHYRTAAGYRRWPSEELVRFMASVPASDSSCWLEAGCGGGGNLAAMRAPGRTVVGIDAHLPALQVAQVGHRAVAAADIFSLPFADGTFDGVVDSMVSQHVRSCEHVRLYREYRRVLKPGGVLWVYHLDSRTWCSTMRPVSMDDTWEWTGLSLFPTVPFFCLPSPRQLESWIERAGLRIVSACFLRRTYQGQVASYAVMTAARAITFSPSLEEER